MPSSSDSSKWKCARAFQARIRRRRHSDRRRLGAARRFATATRTGHDAILKLMDTYQQLDPDPGAARQAVPDADRGRVLDLGPRHRRHRPCRAAASSRSARKSRSSAFATPRRPSSPASRCSTSFSTRARRATTSARCFAASAVRTSSAGRFSASRARSSRTPTFRPGFCPVEGRGRPSHAVLRQLSSAVLLPHHGRHR